MATSTQLILAGCVSVTSYLQAIVFIHVEVTSPNTLNSSLSNFVMAESTSRFATLSAEDLDLLLDDKDVHCKVFHQYLKEKKADEPQTKETLANVLKLFYAEARKVDGTSYSNICSHQIEYAFLCNCVTYLYNFSFMSTQLI